jgi:hypothetical protein
VRLTEVSAGRVIRELYYFLSIINHACREWGINITNPEALVRKPAYPKVRGRLLNSAEKQRILEIFESAPETDFSIWMPHIIEFGGCPRF